MQDRSVILRIFVWFVIVSLSSAAFCQVTSADVVSSLVAVRGKTPKHTWSLTNLSCGASPESPIDPSIPTFVITHGWNPMPNKFYLSTPEAYACKIRNRYGAGANVLAYHWDSRYQGRPTRNDQNAIRAGEILADALVLRGVVPEQTHMIGHSMGSLVIAAAAHRIHCETARRTDKLTMLDGPSWKVEIFIDQLAAPSCANRVINLWAAGPTGAGMPIDRAGVENVEIPNRRARLRTRRRGAKHCRELQPAVINHIDILHWYYEHRL